MPNLTPDERRVMRAALMRSVRVVAKGTFMTEPSTTPRTDALNRFDNPENQSLFAWVKLAAELETALSDVRGERDQLLTEKGLLEWYTKTADLLTDSRAETREARTYAENASEALEDLKHLLAKQLMGLKDHGQCAACGKTWKDGEPDAHEDSCPVNCGLAIIEAALAYGDVEPTLDTPPIGHAICPQEVKP